MVIPGFITEPAMKIGALLILVGGCFYGAMNQIPALYAVPVIFIAFCAYIGFWFFLLFTDRAKFDDS